MTVVSTCWPGGGVDRRSGRRARGTLGAAPGVVPARVKADEAPDQREREERLGAGHGTKDTGSGLAFGKTSSSTIQPPG